MAEVDAATQTQVVSPERVREVTHEILVDTGVPDDSLDSSMSLEDLGLDSSDVVQIELDLQRRTGLRLEFREQFPALTVDTLVTKVVQAAAQ